MDCTPSFPPSSLYIPHFGPPHSRKNGLLNIDPCSDQMQERVNISMHTLGAADRSAVVCVHVAMILMLGRSPCTAKTRKQDAIHNADQRNLGAFLVRQLRMGKNNCVSILRLMSFYYQGFGVSWLSNWLPTLTLTLTKDDHQKSTCIFRNMID